MNAATITGIVLAIGGLLTAAVAIYRAPTDRAAAAMSGEASVIASIASATGAVNSAALALLAPMQLEVRELRERVAKAEHELNRANRAEHECKTQLAHISQELKTLRATAGGRRTDDS